MSTEIAIDTFVRINDQIFMVLNGHYANDGGESCMVTQNSFGNDVFIICADYQFYPSGGNGYLRIHQFDIPKNRINVQTYSPWLDTYMTGSSSQFTLDIDFDSRFDFNAGSFAGGDGSPANPYQVGTREQLEYVNHGLTKNYILIIDIDLAGKIYKTALMAIDTYSSTLDFVGGAFTGSFDGNGYSIKNLTIAGVGNYNHGLFGRIDGGTVTDLGVENVSISGGVRYAGGIAATTKNANISGCHVTGTISSGPYVGGLVGDTDATNSTNSYAIVTVASSGWAVGGAVGRLTTTSTITDSYSKSTINCSSDNNQNTRVGGLVGDMIGHAVVERCFSDSNVEGYRSVGGLVGNYSWGYIYDSYALGSVHGEEEVGGLVGAFWAATAHNDSYAAVEVTADSNLYVGGYMGRVGSDYGNYDISGCFWDTQISGQTYPASDRDGNYIEPIGVTGTATDQMNTQSTFTDAGWDYAIVWAQCVGEYPGFRWDESYLLNADFNGDCNVNMSDLKILAGKWLGAGIGDIDNNGVVNFEDFAIMAIEWLDE